MPFYELSNETRKINIYFKNVPPYIVRKNLKDNGWNWDSTSQCWWNDYNHKNIIFASSLYPPSATSFPLQRPHDVDIIKEGFCGPSAVWYLASCGELIINGKGEITGYKFEDLPKSPLYRIRDCVRSLRVQSGITAIGKRAFYGFTNLETADLADSIIEIGDRAFSQCTNLRLIQTPKRLKNIGDQAFNDCCSLLEIHLPVTVSTIGADCFKNWNSNQIIYQIKTDACTGKQIEYSRTPSNKASIKKVSFEDFVAVSTDNYCVNSGHIHENIQVLIDVLRRDGTLITEILPASYCINCQKYSIGIWQFEELKKKGVVLCRIIYDHFDFEAKDNGFYSELSPESILKQWGYSVNSSNDLTDEQRHQILICLMESGICSKQKITSHLSWLITSRNGRSGFENAVCKWENDRKFVSSYEMGSGRAVALRSLKIRK